MVIAIAIAIGSGLFAFFADLGHIWDLVMYGDTSLNNAGAVIYINLLYPILLAALFIWYRKKPAVENTVPTWG
jgi:H+/Cl- antiporter ClcA